MGAHLGVWGFIPSHSPTLSGAWNVTPRLHSSLLARTFVSLCLSCETKARVATIPHTFLHSRKHEIWFSGSLLACTFASPCLGCERKARVAILVFINKDYFILFLGSILFWMVWCDESIKISSILKCILCITSNHKVSFSELGVCVPQLFMIKSFFFMQGLFDLMQMRIASHIIPTLTNKDLWNCNILLQITVATW